jgi:hypothetical protein
MVNILNGQRTAARGAVLYRGPSQITGDNIVAIAIYSSRNAKTGNMAQVYILRDDMSPRDAVNSKADDAICGSCQHRGTTCYVQIDKGPSMVYKSFIAGKYDEPETLDGALAGYKIRWGAYGDPAALPLWVLERASQGCIGVTGYTHQWRVCDPGFARFCMASVDDWVERIMAKGKGYRTFRVSAEGERGKKEFTCPASKEAGNVTDCMSCMACGGTSSSNSADVTIQLHGGPVIKAIARRMGRLAA